MGYQGELSGEHPPLARKGQVSAFHLCNSDILAAFNLADVFVESRTKSALALSGALGCLPNID
jgi:hypothetical protein